MVIRIIYLLVRSCFFFFSTQGDDHVQRDRKEELVAVPSLQVDNRRRRQSRDEQNIVG